MVTCTDYSCTWAVDLSRNFADHPQRHGYGEVASWAKHEKGYVGETRSVTRSIKIKWLFSLQTNKQNFNLVNIILIVSSLFRTTSFS